jgi:hypothetical protein
VSNLPKLVAAAMCLGVVPGLAAQSSATAPDASLIWVAVPPFFPRGATTTSPFVMTYLHPWEDPSRARPLPVGN